jgi:hypothetical protein
MTTTHSERIDAIRLDVAVPGTEIRAQLRDRDQVTLSFGRGRYDYMRERDLEHHLATLARLLYTGWIRAYRATISETMLDSFDPESQTDQEYAAARDRLTSRGASGDGRITMTASGMREVTVKVAAGTIDELDENEFSDATREAVAALIADHLAQVEELKDLCYG